ncbi:hypothetical protein ABT381_23395 [Streptomyces sp. NPDC000151]|uniref:hypothetical protein n=1 Tax=Streptomyces sp. NPDC000151 TaxID=3154244 RepID=UPI00332CFDCE
MARQAHEVAVGGERAAEERARQDRSAFLRWLLFYLVSVAGIAGLMWLGPAVPLPGWIRALGFLLAAILLPLASILVPVLRLRRIPRKQRKGAWQLVLPIIAGVGLAVVSGEAGEDAALQERGQWIKAQVVAVEDKKTDRCTVERLDGREIKPSLSEGGGCDPEFVDEGDVLRVRYDPEEAAGPVDDSWEPGSYGGGIAGLGTVFVVFGTWGSTRMARWDRDYVGA